MSKLIFILFLFFCSLHSFSQESLSNAKINNADFSNKINGLEKEKIETAKVQEPNETAVKKFSSNKNKKAVCFARSLSLGSDNQILKTFSDEKEIVKIYKDNLCDVLTIKVSDLLNESMLKKLLANV
jgi:hypothetical protein